jgi:excinuclease ABC subunit A
LRNKKSLTAKYLANPMRHPLRGNWRPAPSTFLTLTNCSLRNLKNIDVRFALGRLNVVCGVSGSGKSTLVRDLLAPAANAAVKARAAKLATRQLAAAGVCGLAGIAGTASLRQVILVDQDPIGKTPRSTPATYIGAFDHVRRHFANLTEARARGLDASFFSYNTAGGRCDTCGGAGRVKLEMNFLPDTYVPCDACGGGRYGSIAADVRWRGKNIGEVLAMTFEEAAEFFAFDSHLSTLLQLMVRTGLGYLTLGQSSPTLSGGEAQRLKLVSELAKGGGRESRIGTAEAQRNLYLLEEPTIGLHQADCERLLGLLHELVEQGHTIIVIEHHLDIIAEADHLIELGPEGGTAGGHLLHQSSPTALLTANTPTAPFLRETLQGALSGR